MKLEKNEGEVHILVNCPIDTFLKEKQHSAMHGEKELFDKSVYLDCFILSLWQILTYIFISMRALWRVFNNSCFDLARSEMSVTYHCKNCLDNLLPPEVFVGVCSAKPSKASLGEVGRPRTRRSSSRPQKEQCSPSREEVGSTEKSRCPRHLTGEINPEERSLQNGLERYKVIKHTHRTPKTAPLTLGR